MHHGFQNLIGEDIGSNGIECRLLVFAHNFRFWTVFPFKVDLKCHTNIMTGSTVQTDYYANFDKNLPECDPLGDHLLLADNLCATNDTTFNLSFQTPEKNFVFTFCSDTVAMMFKMMM